MTGIVIHRGHVAATWGEPDRVDITHSITKTFLTTVVGLAWQRGLIKDLSATAKRASPQPNSSPPSTMPHHVGPPAAPDKRLVRHAVGYSDWADRPVGATAADHPKRPMHTPGTFFKLQ